MTVKEFKDSIALWPEINREGEPAEVWMETGEGLTSEVRHVCALNGTIVTGCDILIRPSQFAWTGAEIGKVKE